MTKNEKFRCKYSVNLKEPKTKKPTQRQIEAKEEWKKIKASRTIENCPHTYRDEVRRLTELNAHKVDGIEKRGWQEYHLDHIVPICYGFENKIPPKKMASLDNLQMLYWKENLFVKKTKLTIKGKEILAKWGIMSND